MCPPPSRANRAAFCWNQADVTAFLPSGVYRGLLDSTSFAENSRGLSPSIWYARDLVRAARTATVRASYPRGSSVWEVRERLNLGGSLVKLRTTATASDTIQPPTRYQSEWINQEMKLSAFMSPYADASSSRPLHCLYSCTMASMAASRCAIVKLPSISSSSIRPNQKPKARSIPDEISSAIRLTNSLLLAACDIGLLPKTTGRKDPP